MKRVLITTPLYYASGKPHIGHLYSSNLAWVLRNLKRMFGYDAMLLGGIDEHGTKIEQKANENKLKPKEYVDQINNDFIKLWKDCQIDFDFYERTTNENHKTKVKEIFEKMLKNQQIELKKYKSWYSVSDEEFVTLSNAIKREGEYYHPVSFNKLVKIDETNYFFIMSKYEKWLKNYLNTNQLVFPPRALNEVSNSFIEKGLEDLSVTRQNIEWGIKTITDSQQTIYVWLDALFGYLTGLGFGSEDSQNFSKYWVESEERIHVLGKEISRFHLIYFPIFLKSLNLNLPTRFLVHGWLLSKNMKMSKSIGNVIDPYDLLKIFEPEMIKFYFVAKIDPKNDGNIDIDAIFDTINAELINNYGNLISRTLKMVSNSFSNGVKYSEPILDIEHEIESDLRKINNEILLYLNSFNIHQIFNKVIEFSSKLNNYIDQTKPWTLTDNLVQLERILNYLLNGIYAISTYLKAVMPNKIREVEKALKVKLNINEIANFKKFDNVITDKSFMLWNRLKK